MENKVAGEKITTENPCNFESHTAGAENNLEKKMGDDSLSLGKFKDVQSLFDAYNSLQAEFTRKSQKLADFQKHKFELSHTQKRNIRFETS